jgi:microcystin-dependent protein
MIIHIPDFPTASVTATLRAAAPEGWLLLNGQTVGNASSGASGRASADTEALFLTLWNDAAAEVVGGRGDTAAADYAANKELVLPNASGRTLAGKDEGEVLEGAEVLGSSLGSQSHALSLAETPNHEHSLNNSATFDSNGGTQSNGVGSSVTDSHKDVTPPVTGQAHNNVQPTLVVNWMIKL